MTAVELARFFHDTYERLASDFGYETRQDTREFSPASKNGQLMVAVCAEVLTRLGAWSAASQPPPVITFPEDMSTAERIGDPRIDGQPPAVLSPAPLNVDGIVLSDGHVELIGTATQDSDTGKYRCLANVGGALCVVEIKVTPSAADNGTAGP